MGYGDFKLLAALGAWMGWKALLPIVLLSSLVGAVVGIALIVLARRGREIPIPFGPYLAAAGMIMMLTGDQLTRVVSSALMSAAFSVGLTGGVGSGKSTIGAMLAGPRCCTCRRRFDRASTDKRWRRCHRRNQRSIWRRGDCRRWIAGPGPHARSCLLRHGAARTARIATASNDPGCDARTCGETDRRGRALRRTRRATVGRDWQPRRLR